MAWKLMDRTVEELVADIITFGNDIEMHLYNQGFGIRNTQAIGNLRYRARKLSGILYAKGYTLHELALKNSELEYAMQFF